MIRTGKHGDVTRVELSSARSRAIGMSVSAYVVRGVMVDCGFPAVGDELWAWLAENERLRGCFISHGHEDHSGNAELLATKGVPLGIAAATETMLHHPEPLAFYRRFTWGSPRPLVSPVTPFYDDQLRLIPAPGHAADHHVVWDSGEGTLFAADLFLGVRVSVAHVSERPRELVRSLRAVSSLGARRLFDAHRGAVADPSRALAAKISWMEDLIGKIETLSGRGLGQRAIQRALLGREGLSGFFSGGEYSKMNLVRAVLNEE